MQMAHDMAWIKCYIKQMERYIQQIEHYIRESRPSPHLLPLKKLLDK